MDESAQQAVQIGVNLVIFIAALSLGITLMIGVRDVAELASEYDASIPTGSRVVTVVEQKKRTIKGSEILSYYANYMTDINGAKSEKYFFEIENAAGNIVFDGSTDLNGKTIEEYLKWKDLELTNDFEVIISEYNKEENVTLITLKEIE